MHKRQNVILIVDDTPENLRVLGELLEADGHEVRVSAEGARGLEIARGGGVDLVLLDVMMPDMDGYAVCKKLKQDKHTRDIPVIFLTALDSPDDEAKGLKLGAVDYIAKPFKIDLVRSRVANHLALHNARRELRRHNEKLEELVAERSQELAAAHRRLMTIDSAKYDFLQIIYQKLWVPGQGIIDLSREAMNTLDPGRPGLADLKLRYEESQAELFDTINNALLMAGTQSGEAATKPYPVKLESLVEDAMAKWEPVARRKEVRFEGKVGLSALASGELDLVYQVVSTVVHAAVQLARPGTAVVLGGAASAEEVTWVLTVDVEDGAGTQLATLFDESIRFHPSPVGQALGLAIPLASKILHTLGGRITLADGGTGSWAFRTTLPRFVRKAGARIRL